MQITTGIQQTALKVVIYGPEGIGKSTMAAAFPDPVFIDTEGSTKHMDVARLPKPTSAAMLLDEVRWARDNSSQLGTLVVNYRLIRTHSLFFVINSSFNQLFDIFCFQGL